MNIYSFSRYSQKWKSWFRLSLKLIHWVCLSNNPPSHCISLNSFSQTLLLIISFPSYILYNLHILIHPLVCQHILFLIHLTYFYWPSPGFPDHLLLLLPPPHGFPDHFLLLSAPLWFLIPPSLIFTEVPSKGSLITYFYWYPLGLPQGDTWTVRYRECYDSCPASCCHSDRSVVGRRSLIGCRWLRCWGAWHTRVGGRPLRNQSP